MEQRMETDTEKQLILKQTSNKKLINSFLFINRIY